MKKFTSFLLAFAMLFTLAATVVPAKTALAVDSGSCGDNVTWTLEDGTLTISGEGDMVNYSSLYVGQSGCAPWLQHSSRIYRVVVTEGVTSIAKYAFSYLDNVTSTTIPSTIREIGSYAFYGCTTKAVTLPEGLTTIGNSVFMGSKIKTINIPESLVNYPAVNSVGPFCSCKYLKEIVVAENNPILCSYNNGLYSKDKKILYAYPALNSATEHVTTNELEAIAAFAITDCVYLKSMKIMGDLNTMHNGAISENRNLASIYFYGNAPSDLYSGVLSSNSGSLTLYYRAGYTGWTNPWQGCETKLFVDDEGPTYTPRPFDDSSFLTIETTDIYGNPFSGSSFTKYNFTLFNVWATWCGPCKAEMPDLQKLYEEYSGCGVNFVGLLVDYTNTDGAQTLYDEFGMTYTSIVPDAFLAKQLRQISAYPTTYFINNKGEILTNFTHEGTQNYDAWKSAIKQVASALNVSLEGGYSPTPETSPSPTPVQTEKPKATPWVKVTGIDIPETVKVGDTVNFKVDYDIPAPADCGLTEDQLKELTFDITGTGLSDITATSMQTIVCVEETCNVFNDMSRLTKTTDGYSVKFSDHQSGTIKFSAKVTAAASVTALMKATNFEAKKTLDINVQVEKPKPTPWVKVTGIDIPETVKVGDTVNFKVDYDIPAPADCGLTEDQLKELTFDITGTGLSDITATSMQTIVCVAETCNVFMDMSRLTKTTDGYSVAFSDHQSGTIKFSAKVTAAASVTALMKATNFEAKKTLDINVQVEKPKATPWVKVTGIDVPTAVKVGDTVNFKVDYDIPAPADCGLTENQLKELTFNIIGKGLSDITATSMQTIVCVAETCNVFMDMSRLTKTTDGYSVAFSDHQSGTIKFSAKIASTEASVSATLKATGFEDIKTLDFPCETPVIVPGNGDVNGDGEMSLLDIVLVMRKLAGWQGITIDEKAADFNGDGNVTQTDVLLMMRKLAGWKTVA